MCNTEEKEAARLGEKKLVKGFGDSIRLANMPSMTAPFYQANKRAPLDSTLAGSLLGDIGKILGCREKGEVVEEAHFNLMKAKYPPKNINDAWI